MLFAAYKGMPLRKGLCMCVCVEVSGDNPQIGARVASISVINPVYWIRQHSFSLRPR